MSYKHKAPSLVALPTIEWPVVRLVATPAKTHVKWLNLVCNCHFLDLTVAEGTHFRDILDLHPRVIKDKFSQMLFVSKVDEIRDVMHLFPWWRLTFFPVFRQFLDTISVSGDDTMATHTLAGRWNTGYLAAPGIGMTVHAVDLVDFCMYVVREFNRLFDVFPVICADGWNRVRHFGINNRRQ